MARVVRCPTCGAELEWSDAFPFRPFCSERCRLIDLGAWAEERHKIPGSPLDEEDAADDPAETR